MGAGSLNTLLILNSTDIRFNGWLYYIILALTNPFFTLKSLFNFFSNLNSLSGHQAPGTRHRRSEPPVSRGNPKVSTFPIFIDLEMIRVSYFFYEEYFSTVNFV